MKQNRKFFRHTQLLLLISLFCFIFLFLNLNFTKTSSDDKFNKVNTFFKVLRLIESNYVTEPNTDLLVEGAISGMINNCLLYTSPSPRD